MVDISSAIFVIFLVCGQPTLYFDTVKYSDNTVSYTLELMDEINNPDGFVVIKERMELAQKLHSKVFLIEQTKIHDMKCLANNKIIST